jgi:hypothetical protein
MRLIIAKKFQQRFFLIEIERNCIIHDLYDIKMKQELMLIMSNIYIYEYYIRIKIIS